MYLFIFLYFTQSSWILEFLHDFEISISIIVKAESKILDYCILIEYSDCHCNKTLSCNNLIKCRIWVNKFTLHFWSNLKLVLGFYYLDVFWIGIYNSVDFWYIETKISIIRIGNNLNLWMKYSNGNIIIIIKEISAT